MTSELPARQPTVFELDRLVEYSDSAILDELRRVAGTVPNDPLTTRLFQHYSRVSVGTVTQRFGSWGDALIAAELSDRWYGSRAAQLAATKRLTDDAILNHLVNLASRLGKTELTWRDVAAHLPFGADILKRRWGSAGAAFEAAGLSSTRRGHRYSDDECFDNLLMVWTHHGRAPRSREMGEPPSKVGASAYVGRFGTWNKALTSFVDRVNSDLDNSSSDTATVGTAPVAEPRSTGILESSRDKRAISLGVRFSVLKRDYFKCVLCGDSPSSNPACTLHVDHIVPWSKGGRTSVENLRSLCSSCNVGRGNRYGD